MTEIEYRFLNIDKDQIRKKLEEIDAAQIHKEFKMNRCIFHVDDNPQIKGNIIRVRKEFDKTTLTYKDKSDGAEFSEEIEIEVSDYADTIKILEKSGLKVSTTQESLRETWQKDHVLITIDTRPHLDPYIEIESKNESLEDVEKVAKDLGVDWNAKTTKSVAELYSDKYGISVEQVHVLVDTLTFDTNPFE
jgi:adenylate cyclase class 2